MQTFDIQNWSSLGMLDWTCKPGVMISLAKWMQILETIQMVFFFIGFKLTLDKHLLMT